MNLLGWCWWLGLLSFLPAAAFADTMLSKFDAIMGWKLPKCCGVLLAVCAYLMYLGAGAHLVQWALARSSARACEATDANEVVVNATVFLAASDSLSLHVLTMTQLVVLLVRTMLHALVILLRLVLQQPWQAAAIAAAAMSASLQMLRWLREMG